MIGTCASCKHWKDPEEYGIGVSMGIRKCAALPMFWSATDWTEDGERRIFNGKGKGSTAFLQDSSDYVAYLYTKAEHGCTMHVPILTTKE